MAEVRKVSIALTLEQIEVLKTAVETGDYATTSEIVREAIRDWQLNREVRQKEIERLPGFGTKARPADPQLQSILMSLDAMRRGG